MNNIIQHRAVKEYVYYPDNAKELTKTCLQPIGNELIPKLIFRFALCDGGDIQMKAYAAFENSLIEKCVLTTRYHNRENLFEDKVRLLSKVQILVKSKMETSIDWEEIFLREEFKVDNWLSPKFQEKENKYTMKLVEEFLKRNEEDYYD